ncbi:Cytochrome P450 [Penicillium expansum]|uniref:Cytochrome P450 n=1 Tax=Penicillium expansum TaxID=27334 RepID=A0A0A2K6J0_PENEN|nr:Cytochrome P450 [Penicillium expansum]KAJ5519064.1 Cytochrome P450 [Penicillium expansum]KGO47178.1 Cytochrome P450 [Penicillium expansum]KGO52264.1 Cytochrome P450 [Penicillium expansum]KGO63459.1 Cytochrome P450 [Penicillium expansum]
MVIQTLWLLGNLPTISLAGLALLSGLFFLLNSAKTPQLPLVNGKRQFEFSIAKARQRYLADAHNLIMSGLAKARAFRVVTENGVRTILSADYAEDIRSHRSLSLSGALVTEHHVHIAGFDAVRVTVTSDIIQDTVRTKLTQHLLNITGPMSDEADYVLKTQWTDDTDWHDVHLRTKAVGLIASLSSRVFLGEKICRNPEWLRITINYTIDSLMAAAQLRLWPEMLRPLAAKFLPKCHKIRQELQEAKDIITPVIEERHKARKTAVAEGRPEETYHDAIQWLEENSSQGHNKFDPAAMQLALSTAAIHTTTDLLTQTILDLCGREELIKELRKEIIEVLGDGGWDKSTMYKLKLMDSVIKESQRVKPMAIAKMARKVEADVKLSDGTIVPKGEIILVSCSKMWDPSIYPDPETFDPYRFLKLREGSMDKEALAQFVSPSPQHMGFGFGKHACPGRFFAAAEMKVILCHVIMKYDFKVAEGCTPSIFKSGMRLSADPFARIAIRRRKEEITI